MSRVKDPSEKKRLSLARDHRVFALEGNKTFRKAWRLKKAKAARQLRRTQAREETVGPCDSGGQPERSVRQPRRSLRKLGVMSLSQAITFKREEFGSRWSCRILGKNRDALAAMNRTVRNAPRSNPKR